MHDTRLDAIKELKQRWLGHFRAKLISKEQLELQLAGLKRLEKAYKEDWKEVKEVRTVDSHGKLIKVEEVKE